jgi:hypothetical protein
LSAGAECLALSTLPFAILVLTRIYPPLKMELASALEIGRKQKKPVVDNPAALCSELFGIDALHIKELDSYDDRNFLIETPAREKFVLKVHNGIDTENLPFLQAQNELIRLLDEANFNVPRAIPAVAKTADGLIALAPVSFVDGSAGTCAVRLLVFLDFPLMSDVPLHESVFHQLGVAALSIVWLTCAGVRCSRRRGVPGRRHSGHAAHPPVGP